MPRTTAAPKISEADNRKPYDQPASKTVTSGATFKTKKGAVSARLPWTDLERLALFRIAITKGPSITNFEGALEGRSGHLCYCQWYKNILPSIEKMYGAGGSKSQGGSEAASEVFVAGGEGRRRGVITATDR